MERYVHDENIVRYRKLIAISEGDPARDEARHHTLLRLLAEALANDVKTEPLAACRTRDHSCFDLRCARPGTAPPLAPARDRVPVVYKQLA